MVVQRRINVDLFSDYRPYAYVISTADWETKYAPPALQIYLVFMLACGLPWLACSLPTVADSTLPDPSIGCISDYCSEKTTIKDCMVHAHICDDCKRVMLDNGLSRYFLDSTEKILAWIRERMVAYDVDKYSFIVGEKVGWRKDFLSSSKPPKIILFTIKKSADEYAVALLNDKGGDVFWGIRDDGVVLGITLTWAQRDQIRQVVSENLNKIKPSISNVAYRLEFYKTHDGEGREISDRWIVRLNVSPGSPFDLYATGSNEVFIKTHGGKQKLFHLEMVAEIKRRTSL